MTRIPLSSEPFAPLRRCGAFVIVFGGLLAAPLFVAGENQERQPALDVEVAMSSALPRADVTRRIEQAWRIETVLRRGDVQMAQAAR